MATQPSNETVVKATYKRKPRFKAGSDLSKEVGLQIHLDVENHSTEEEESISVTIHAVNVSEDDGTP